MTLAVVGATPVLIILGTDQFKLPEVSEPKKELFEGATPGKL